MIETDTRTDGSTERNMVRSNRLGYARQCRGAIANRTATKLPPEGASEDLVTSEPASQGDFQHGLAAADEPARRLFEAQPLQESFRGFTQEGPKSAVEVEPGRPHSAGEVRERNIAIEIPTDIPHQVEQIGPHDRPILVFHGPAADPKA